MLRCYKARPSVSIGNPWDAQAKGNITEGGNFSRMRILPSLRFEPHQVIRYREAIHRRSGFLAQALHCVVEVAEVVWMSDAIHDRGVVAEEYQFAVYQLADWMAAVAATGAPEALRKPEGFIHMLSGTRGVAARNWANAGDVPQRSVSKASSAPEISMVRIRFVTRVRFTLAAAELRYRRRWA